MSHTLFVYGTLLPGLCRHDAMLGARWLGPAHIHVALYDLGPYPAVVRGKGVTHGLLADIDDDLLARLDAIEEYHPQAPARSEYLRQRITAYTDAGHRHEAWCYVYGRDLGAARHLAHGDYRRHLQETGYVPSLQTRPRALDV